MAPDNKLGRLSTRKDDLLRTLPTLEADHVARCFDSYLVGALVSEISDETWDEAVETALATSARVARRLAYED